VFSTHEGHHLSSRVLIPHYIIALFILENCIAPQVLQEISKRYPGEVTFTSIANSLPSTAVWLHILWTNCPQQGSHETQMQTGQFWIRYFCLPPGQYVWQVCSLNEICSPFNQPLNDFVVNHLDAVTCRDVLAQLLFYCIAGKFGRH